MRRAIGSSQSPPPEEVRSLPPAGGQQEASAPSSPLERRGDAGCPLPSPLRGSERAHRMRPPHPAFAPSPLLPPPFDNRFPDGREDLDALPAERYEPSTRAVPRVGSHPTTDRESRAGRSDSPAKRPVKQVTRPSATKLPVRLHEGLQVSARCGQRWGRHHGGGGGAAGGRGGGIDGGVAVVILVAGRGGARVWGKICRAAMGGWVGGARERPNRDVKELFMCVGSEKSRDGLVVWVGGLG